MSGFLLGLSTGAVCVSYCAPALMPFLLGEGKKTSKNFLYLIEFLSGRLLGYILFGIIAWIASGLLSNISSYKELAYGSVYIVLAVSMFLYSFFNREKAFCVANSIRGKLSAVMTLKEWILPLVLGFLTGLSLCPPFLLAFTGAANEGGLLQSVLFFITFFMGTAIYFIPAPFVGILNIHKQLQVIGKMASVIASLYYLYMGAIYIIEWVGFK